MPRGDPSLGSLHREADSLCADHTSTELQCRGLCNTLSSVHGGDRAPASCLTPARLLRQVRSAYASLSSPDFLSPACRRSPNPLHRSPLCCRAFTHSCWNRAVCPYAFLLTQEAGGAYRFLVVTESYRGIGTFS